MKELFLLKLGEIVLKGQNRRVFEDKLKTVTRRRMVKFGEFKVSIVQSTLYVEPLTDDCDLDGAWEACGTIFLAICLARVYAGHFTPRQHFGFEAAAWYWHFVDVVWLFLFVSIYVWGGAGAPVHAG